jgi:hypothetical protein
MESVGCRTTPVVTRTGEAPSFDFIEVSLDLRGDLRPASRLLSGLHRFGEVMQRLEIAQIMGIEVSGGWMLFRFGGGNFLLAGIASWRVFPAEVVFRGGRLVFRFCGAGKRFGAGESLRLEDLYVGRAESERAAFDAYTEFLVKNLDICFRPRVWRGWGDWDYYTSHSCEESLLDNIRRVKALCPEANLLQIDAGYATHSGDWMEPDPAKFPHGLGPVVREAAMLGMESGIWIAPCQAHIASRVVREHPDWFEHARDGSLRRYGIDPVTIFDFSQDEPLEYLKTCVRNFRDIGFSYYKLDFLLCGSDAYGSAKNPMTPYERLHRCFEAFREAAGPDAYILSGSSNFGPCLGHIDAQRVGPDISPDFDSVRHAAVSAFASMHYHRRLFQCDPDYLVARGEGMTDASCTSPGKIGRLTDIEAKCWADFVSLVGDCVLNADKLALLSPERSRLVADALNGARANHVVAVPDYWRGGTDDTPAMVVADGRLGVFNFGAAPRTFCLPDGTERTLAPHASLILDDAKWDGRQLPCIEKPLAFHDPLGAPFGDTAAFEPLSLVVAANARLAYDFDYGSEVMDDVYSPLAGVQSLLGVRLDIGERAITISHDAREADVTIPVGRTVSAIYLLHAAAYPVTGPWIEYTVRFADGAEALHPVVVNRDIGNVDYNYTCPLQSDKARLAWHDASFAKGAYLMEIDFGKARPVDSIRVSRPCKSGTHILLAAATRI